MENDILALPVGSEETEKNSIYFYVDENGNKYIKREDLEKISNIDFPDRSFSINSYEGTFYPVSKSLEEIIARESFQLVDIKIESSNVAEINVDSMIDTTDSINPEEDTVDDTVEDSDEDTVDDTAEDSDEDTVEDSDEDTADDTVEDSDEDTADDTADDTVEDTVEDSDEDTVEDTVEDSDEDTAEDTVTVRKSDLEYKKMIDDRINMLASKLADFKSKSGRDITGHVSTTINGLEIEIEELRRISAELGSRTPLNGLSESSIAFLDDRRDANEDKQNKYQERIAELQEMKSQLKRRSAKFITDKRIEHLQKKIKKLQERDCFCGSIQRKIMYPRYLVEAKKRNLLSHAQGRVQDYENRIHDNEMMSENLDEMFGDSIFNGARQVIYDIKGMYFRKRLERSQAILAEMQDSNNIVSMYGARVTSLSRGQLDRIRQANQQAVQMNDGAVAAI